jgi:hypothetical protein
MDRIPVGKKFSALVQTGSGAQLASYAMGTRSFPVVKRPGRGVDYPPPNYMRGLRTSRDIHLVQIWAFVVCSRLKFIFFDSPEQNGTSGVNCTFAKLYSSFKLGTR